MTRVKFALTGCVAVIALLVTACTGDSKADGDPADPYGAEFESAINDSSSEFVKGVLADHAVTAAEYGESQDRYVSCLEEAGLHPERAEALAGFTTYVQVGLPAGEYDSESASNCENEWVGSISDLYIALNQNPQNVDYWDLVATCLVETGVTPSGTSGQDISEAFTKVGSRYTQDDGGEQLVAGPEDPHATLPGGVAWDDERLNPCMANPLNPQQE